MISRNCNDLCSVFFINIIIIIIILMCSFLCYFSLGAHSPLNETKYYQKKNNNKKTHTLRQTTSSLSLSHSPFLSPPPTHTSREISNKPNDPPCIESVYPDMHCQRFTPARGPKLSHKRVTRLCDPNIVTRITRTACDPTLAARITRTDSVTPKNS